MILYLLRHGEASHSDPGKPSSLTPKGKADVTRLAEHFVKKHWKIDALWHSPKTRAIQTAGIFREALEIPGKNAEEKNSLSPEGDIQEIYREILAQKSERLLLVSHLPFLPSLASLLTESPSPPFSFPTSGMAAFEADKTFKLLWTLDPLSLK